MHLDVANVQAHGGDFGRHGSLAAWELRDLNPEPRRDPDVPPLSNVGCLNRQLE